MTAEDAELPPDAEALLTGWPDVDRSEASWDEMARTIDARIAEVAPGGTEDALLAAPLPAGDDEPRDGAPVTASGVDPAPRPSGEQPRSLADLARSIAKADDDDSVARIAQASLSLASRERLASAPQLVAPEAQRDVETDPPVAAATAAVSSLDEHRERRVAPAPADASSKAGWVFGVGAAALGIAAAFALLLNRPEPRSAPAFPLVAGPELASQAAPAVAATPTPDRPGAADGIVDLDELPTGERERERAPAVAAGPRGSIAAAPVHPPDEPAPAAEAKDAVRVPAEVAAREAPAAAEPDDPKLQMAAQAEPTRLQPSTGEVQAALGAVMGSARACVAAHDQPSRAAVTFGSDGRVSGVSVSGGAAGTPASACIEGALRRARVAPFSKASFSAAATIRP